VSDGDRSGSAGHPAGASPSPEHGPGEWHDPALIEWWHREFTDGVDPEYTEQIIPLVVQRLAGAGRVLDIGTGEGQVARALAAAGADVVGVDPFPGQAIEAARRNRAFVADRNRRSAAIAGDPPATGPEVALAEAAALPLRDGSFDAAVACLVFEHIDDLDRAIGEVARVLRPGGRFLFLLNHPLLQTPDSGWIDDHVIDPPEQYWRIGPYLPEAATIEEVQRGVLVRFLHRPLSRYVNALAAAGLSIERMDEPAPPPGFLAQAPSYALADTVPRLLALLCRAGDPVPQADPPGSASAMG
jgi:SAM-dependent methyltransferase